MIRKQEQFSRHLNFYTKFYAVGPFESQEKKQETQLSLTNLRDAFIGQSRSPNIVPFHTLDIVSYCAIVTLSLKSAVFTIIHFENVVTLKSGSDVTQGH